MNVVLYPKDTEKWKQFTTCLNSNWHSIMLFCIPKILKNESNSQLSTNSIHFKNCCFVSQRYWKMKAIHNTIEKFNNTFLVVLYPKDTEKWKQFTTCLSYWFNWCKLFCIPKILKNESNSQLINCDDLETKGCFVSQRYWKMKAIHNLPNVFLVPSDVVLYPKDTEKWKQFTTYLFGKFWYKRLFCIPKILKNESNSQLKWITFVQESGCFVSQRYWKMKAIHNIQHNWSINLLVVLYPKDTEKWKQFTTNQF